MAAKKKTGTVRRVTEAVKDAASSVAHAAQEHVIQPVGEALGLAGSKPTAKKSAAARMMTRSVAAPKTAAGKGKAKRAASVAKPSQKPSAGAGRKGPGRGASKGR
jgi:hypothetical protein